MNNRKIIWIGTKTAFSKVSYFISISSSLKLRRGNILCVLNGIQFTGRIRTEKCLYDLYEPNGSSNRISPSLRLTSGNILSVVNEMQFTDRLRTEKCLYDVF